MIDQIKLKCNNTGKNNFKQNLEAIKELVITKAEEQRAAASKDAAAAAASEDKSQSAAESTTPGSGEEKKEQKDINLTWFINYILTKRISG